MTGLILENNRKQRFATRLFWMRSPPMALNLFFAAGERVDNPAGLSLVGDWGLAGHAVGNHTYSHSDFNEKSTTLAAFITDVERNEILLNKYHDVDTDYPIAAAQVPSGRVREGRFSGSRAHSDRSLPTGRRSAE